MTDNDKPYCMTCSPYADLVFLPAGDALLTRRAKKYSTSSVVVVKFSRSRKRYERQGILVTEEALQKAEGAIKDSDPCAKQACRRGKCAT